MKLATAFLTALALLGFAAAASANCVGMEHPLPADDTAEKPIILPPTAES
jgi:hypothetical protein